MPIRKFARAGRLSVKPLRHYDDERLLRPAHVDEHGHEPRGLVREIYVNDPANVRPVQTEVLLPL